MGITYGKKDKVFRQYGKPSLLLDFARRKSLLDTLSKKNPITFTRASSVATYVDADGLIKRAAVNLALYSEQFDNAVWGKDAGISLSSNQTISPDGKQTADKVTVLANSSNKKLYLNYTPIINTTYTFSVYLKTGGVRYVKVSCGGTGVSNTGAGGSGNDRDFKVDLLNCTITNNIFQYSPTITNIGNGWCRVSITITTDGDGGTISPYVWPLDSDQNTSYTGDGVSGFYVWGAQLEEGSAATPYIKTTSTICGAPRFDHDPITGECKGLLIEEARTNEVLYSQEIVDGTGNWVSVRMEPTISNAAIAPDGTMTADKIIPIATTDTHLMRWSAFPGTNKIRSVFLKAAEYTTAAVGIYSYNIPGNVYVFVDLSSGIITGLSHPAETLFSGIEDYGNGWYRVSFAILATSNSAHMNIEANCVFPSTIATGDGVSGIYVWGAQVEAGSFPTSYIPTTTSTVQRTADIATIEGNDFKRTNLLSYSNLPGPGTYGTVGVTTTENQEIAPDGTMTAAKVEIDLSSGNRTFRANCLGSPSKKYTVSFWVKNVDMPSFSAQIFSINDVGSYSYITGINYTPQVLDKKWSRVFFSFTSLSSTVQLHIQFIRDVGTIGNSFYFWGAQVEQSEYPTDYIPTTTTSASVYNWTNDTQGTMFSVYSKFAPNQQTNRNVWSLDTNGTNYIAVFSDYAFHSDLHNDIVISTGGNGYINVTKPVAGTEVKNSLSYTPLTSSLAVNGSTYQINNSALPPIGRLTIGARAGSFSPLNGHIKKMTYWNSALSGSALQLMTGDE